MRRLKAHLHEYIVVNGNGLCVQGTLDTELRQVVCVRIYTKHFEELSPAHDIDVTMTATFAHQHLQLYKYYFS